MLKNPFEEKRSEPRKTPEKYSSVEFITNDIVPVHLFPVYNESITGLGIIAKEGCAALKHLEVGSVMKAKFKLTEIGGGFENREVEIRHITKDGEDRFKGHYLIGLKILDSA